MRLIGRLLLLFSMLTLLGWCLKIFYFGASSKFDETIAEKEGYKSHAVYFLKNKQHLGFSLPQNATHFKLIIYPVKNKNELSKSLEKDNEAMEFRYQIKIKDKQEEKKYELSANFVEFNNAETKAIVEPFWINDKQQVGLSKTIQLATPTTKEFSLLIESEQLDGYLIRGYFQQRNSSKRVKQQWLRTSSKRKEDLLKYHPFDADSVKDYEISNLYKNAWSSIAPVGKLNKDIDLTRLFEHQDRASLITKKGIDYPEDYVYLPKSHKYTFQLRADASLEFEYRPIASVELPRAEIIRRSPLGKITQRSLAANDLTKIQLGKGKYEVSFSQDVSFKVNSEQPEPFVSLPQAKIHNYYLAKGEKLSYSVSSVAGFEQTFKINAHGLNGAGNAELVVQYYRSGILIGQENLNLNFDESAYMPYMLRKNIGLILPTAVSQKAIKVPEGTEQIVLLNKEQDLLFNLYNNIEQLTAVKTIENKLQSRSQSSWFVLKAEQHLEYKRDKRVVRYLDIDNNAIDTELKTASVETLIPNNSNRFKKIYYLTEAKIDSGSSAASFTKLKEGQANELVFYNKKIESNALLRPSLLVHNSQGNNTNSPAISFENNSVIVEGSQPIEEILLAPVEVGQKKVITITKDPVRDYYINYTKADTIQILKKKFYQAKQTLSYRFYKANKGFTGIGISLLRNIDSPQQLKVSIRRDGKLIRSLDTESSRVFSYYQADKELSKNVLVSPECRAGCYLYQPQFMPLQEGLKAGWYELVIEVSEPQATFIDISRSFYQEGTRTMIFSDEHN